MLRHIAFIAITNSNIYNIKLSRINRKNRIWKCK